MATTSSAYAAAPKSFSDRLAEYMVPTNDFTTELFRRLNPELVSQRRQLLVLCQNMLVNGIAQLKRKHTQAIKLSDAMLGSLLFGQAPMSWADYMGGLHARMAQLDELARLNQRHAQYIAHLMCDRDLVELLDYSPGPQAPRLDEYYTATDAAQALMDHAGCERTGAS